MRTLKTQECRNPEINDGIAIYRWTEVGDSSKDVIRLPDIRLQIAYQHNGRQHLVSAAPVLMADGRTPFIILSTGPVYRCTAPGRHGKLIIGRLTPEEEKNTVPLKYLFRGPVVDELWTRSLYAELVHSAPLTVGMFNSPMWCRKAQNRQSVTPRDNDLVRYELGVSESVKLTSRELKEKWDQMADNACCIGYCKDGFLWEAGMIKSGGVVCIPRQYNQVLNITGSCLLSDIEHIARIQKWRIKF